MHWQKRADVIRKGPARRLWRALVPVKPRIVQTGMFHVVVD